MYVLKRNKLTGDYSVLGEMQFKRIDANDINHGINTFYFFDNIEEFEKMIDEFEKKYKESEEK